MAGVGGASGMIAAGTGGAGGMPIAGNGGMGGASGIGGAGSLGGAGGADGGMGGQGATSATGGSGPQPMSVSTLAFDVLTHSQGGKYAPRNIGAIWIEDGSGAFVKTLEVWAARRARYLTRWNSEAAANRVDAVASATLRSHVAHNATWDLTDASGNAVAPGDYKIIVEVTDRNATGDSYELPFTLGEPLSLTPADVPSYSAMTLAIE